MTILGIGIIGCGNISSTYLKLAPLFQGLEVRAVADLNMDAAQARAEEFAMRAETVETLLASDEIDVVVNLTIPNAHFDVTKRILDSGKHVYSEKPLALTLEQGKKLKDLAKSKELRVGTAPDTFLGGAHQQARALIDDGPLGQIIGGTCHVMSRGMEHWHPNPDFFFQPGGGPVLDMGPYYITNLVQLIGPVKAVCAMTAASLPTRTISNGPRDGEKIPVDTATNIHAVLEFENGAIVTFAASWDVWTHTHPNTELYGTGGTIQVPDPNFFGGPVLVSEGRGELQPLPQSEHPFGVPNEIHGETDQANYRAAGLADMVQAILDNRAHRCDIDLAIHVVDVMTAILVAGSERRWVEITTTCARPHPLSAADAVALLK